MPEMTEEARRQCIGAAAASANADNERVRVPWQNEAKTLAVVNVRLDCIVLNHRSHRIRAQLESHELAEQIRSDPTRESSQQAIAEILRATEGFPDLKTNLKEEGQRDAGIITASGLMVNANTRAVALRDLGEDYIRCAVLPTGSLEQEIDELELRLQVQLDFKQDYTFTNELIFINDYLQTHDKSEEQIALEVRWAASSEPRELERGKKRVQQAIRLLGLIRDIQTMSGGRIPLTFFDDKRQALIEIDDGYQKLSAVDQARAERFRNGRIAGLLVGVGYREMRQIDEDFFETHFAPQAADDDVVSETMDGLSEVSPEEEIDVPGLDVLEPEATDGTPPAVNLIALVDLLAKSADEDTLELATADGAQTRSREVVVDALRTAIESGVDQKQREARSKDAVKLPVTLLGEVSSALERVAKAYPEVAGHSDFEADAFAERLEKVERQLDGLKQVIEGSSTT